MKKFGSLAIQTFAFTTFLVCATRAISQQADSQPGSTSTGWLAISDCLLEFEHTVSVPVQEAGVLQSLEVERNDAVASEQLLARLDSRQLEHEYRSRQFEYAYAYKQASDDSEIKFQENLVRSAQLELAKVEALETSNSVNEFEINQKKLALEAAKFSLQRAENSKERATAGARIKQVELEAAERKRQHASIKAPLSGIVSEIFQQPGEWVQVGQPLFTISDPEHLVVHAHVPIAEIDRTQLVGSAVQVESTTDHGAPIRLNGIVRSYDPRVASRGLIRIHAQILNVKIAGHWQILPGPGKQVTLHLAVPTTKSESLAGPNLLP